jgi:two-component system sensor histidine kinase KdpD
MVVDSMRDRWIESLPAYPARDGDRSLFASTGWLLYLLSVVVVVLLCVVLYAVGVAGTHIATAIPFLIAVLLIAFVWGRGPAVAAALASSILFNYMLIPPPYAFNVPSSEEPVLLVGLLAVALGLGGLADRMRVAKKETEELAASEHLQKTLLNCISHDLRTPLTAVIGSLSTLQAEAQTLEEGVRRELLTIAYREAKQLDRLVGQVLEMTRLEAGVVQVRREMDTLERVLQMAFAHVREGVQGRPCQIDLPSGLPTVPVDTVLLSHAFSNVLDNAVKYSGPESPIHVGASVSIGRLVISVADRGIGISAGQLDRIFEKFYRIRESATPGVAVDGAGLGLAIAKGIVEAHGGQIWAEQRPGGGTVIKMSLPLQ